MKPLRLGRPLETGADAARWIEAALGESAVLKELAFEHLSHPVVRFFANEEDARAWLQDCVRSPGHA
mgnify:CR=1 FL=1